MARGAIRLIGELLSELRKRVAGYFIHILGEEMGDWSLNTKPIAPCQVELGVSASGLPKHESVKDVW